MSEPKAAAIERMGETLVQELKGGGYVIRQRDGLGEEVEIYVADYAAQAFLDIFCSVTGLRGPTLDP